MNKDILIKHKGTTTVVLGLVQHDLVKYLINSQKSNSTPFFNYFLFSIKSCNNFWIFQQ